MSHRWWLWSAPIVVHRDTAAYALLSSGRASESSLIWVGVGPSSIHANEHRITTEGNGSVSPSSCYTWQLMCSEHQKQQRAKEYSLKRGILSASCCFFPSSRLVSTRFGIFSSRCRLRKDVRLMCTTAHVLVFNSRREMRAPCKRKFNCRDEWQNGRWWGNARDAFWRYHLQPAA